MCRNIRTLYNFEPPATDEEIHASALQFVRKLSGFRRPSKANEAAFNLAVEQVARAAHELLDVLVSNAPRAIGRSRPPRLGRATPNVSVMPDEPIRGRSPASPRPPAR
jgi:hypothetical protein